MASILDRYGIKEVADVTFYEINEDGTPGKPVLVLDTLKVSTIEQTGEECHLAVGHAHLGEHRHADVVHDEIGYAFGEVERGHPPPR